MWCSVDAFKPALFQAYAVIWALDVFWHHLTQFKFETWWKDVIMILAKWLLKHILPTGSLCWKFDWRSNRLILDTAARPDVCMYHFKHCNAERCWKLWGGTYLQLQVCSCWLVCSSLHHVSISCGKECFFNQSWNQLLCTSFLTARNSFITNLHCHYK